MPTTLVLYGSQYGHARAYAEWLAEDLGGRALPLAEAAEADLEAADTVVIGASDYAGSLTQADDVVRLAAALEGRKRAFFTVSFSGDVSVPREKLDAVLAKNFGPAFDAAAPTAHFRGGMDYARLSRAHKTAMMGVRAFLRTKRGKSETDQQMLDCYGGRADYSDRASIAPFVERVRGL
ncbi:flavodoxin domain-containing protein [Rothia sp. AR01]|uniref:Flavodoxin domain-containing protein n=1 Tax=Rothia santali TaxID=2949643 RepID=A0A9X2HHF1_9MICC|nr:flavodoxin domain-containing protein [Rothia santali]MCP3425761.1 flavodoxin domain-containing protein [Rothia santali]